MQRTILTTVLALSTIPGATAADGSAAAVPSAVVSTPTADKNLEYVSDFFCFVGGDDAGRVIFAFDVNRGREGDDYDAQTFAMLWVEGEGWRDIGGMQDFDDAEDRFYELPSSKTWAIEGWTSEGVQVRSQRYGIDLRVEAIETHTRRKQGLSVFTTGAATGTLALGDREFTGRVSHEYCFLSDLNPLARRVTDLFGDGFDGIYGVVGDPSTGSDLRFHESGGRLEPLISTRDGFVASGGEVERIEGADFKVKGGSIGGFFRWPARYRGSWAADGTARSFDLDVEDRETVANVIFLGIAVAVVEGTCVIDGQEQPVFGFALVVR